MTPTLDVDLTCPVAVGIYPDYVAVRTVQQLADEVMSHVSDRNAEQWSLEYDEDWPCWMTRAIKKGSQGSGQTYPFCYGHGVGEVCETAKHVEQGLLQWASDPRISGDDYCVEGIASIAIAIDEIMSSGPDDDDLKRVAYLTEVLDELRDLRKSMDAALKAVAP